MAAPRKSAPLLNDSAVDDIFRLMGNTPSRTTSRKTPSTPKTPTGRSQARLSHGLQTPFSTPSPEEFMLAMTQSRSISATSLFIDSIAPIRRPASHSKPILAGLSRLIPPPPTRSTLAGRQETGLASPPASPSPLLKSQANRSTTTTLPARMRVNKEDDDKAPSMVVNHKLFSNYNPKQTISATLAKAPIDDDNPFFVPPRTPARPTKVPVTIVKTVLPPSPPSTPPKPLSLVKSNRELSIKAEGVVKEECSTNLFDAILPASTFSDIHVQAPISLQELEIPIKVDLLEHQLIGVQYIREKEDDVGFKGGIIADDMGTGKTLQMLVAILLDKLLSTTPVSGPNDDSSSLLSVMGGTLIICELSIMDQWKNEIEEKIGEGKLSVLIHHGVARRRNANNQIGAMDVVITTYDTLRADYKAFLAEDASCAINPYVGALFKMTFKRVVLDECHIIKNPGAQRTQSCLALRAECRWVMSGTPIRTKIDDLYPYLAFLGVKGYSDKEVFDRLLGRPLSLKNNNTQSRLEAIALLQSVISCRTIRRWKNPANFPTRYFQTRSIVLTNDYREFYDQMMDKYSAIRELLILVAGIQQRGFSELHLAMMTRSRLACNHPSLVLKDWLFDPQTIRRILENGDLVKMKEYGLCPSTPCAACANYRGSETYPHSLLCQSQRGRDAMKLIRKFKGALSPKLVAVLQILRNIRKEHVGDKAVIYSQYTTMLDCIGEALRNERIGYVTFDGRMDSAARKQSLVTIRSDPSVSVILMSLGAGGTGLNLTQCNHLILTEPAWGFAEEDQAFDRIYRIGQGKPVFIHKFVTENSIEEKMVVLQERKRKLAIDALSESPGGAVNMLTDSAVMAEYLEEWKVRKADQH